MMLIFLAICCIAATVDLTASPPSDASAAALLAMPSVTLAFSVFCERQGHRRHRSEETRLNSSHTVISTLSLHDALPILTASPPSDASAAALLAMPSVTLAFSVFCERQGHRRH